MRHLIILAAIFAAVLLTGCGNGFCTNGNDHIDTDLMKFDCPSGGSGDAGDPVIGDPCDTDFDCPEDAFCDDEFVCSDDLVDDCDPEDESDDDEDTDNDGGRYHHKHRHHKHHNGQNGHIDEA